MAVAARCEDGHAFRGEEGDDARPWVSDPDLAPDAVERDTARLGEIERSEARCGMPFSSFSTGIVTSRSTSSAAWPANCVITCTWTLVTSG